MLAVYRLPHRIFLGEKAGFDVITLQSPTLIQTTLLSLFQLSIMEKKRLYALEFLAIVQKKIYIA